jgi:hypothetical protein
MRYAAQNIARPITAVWVLERRRSVRSTSITGNLWRSSALRVRAGQNLPLHRNRRSYSMTSSARASTRRRHFEAGRRGSRRCCSAAVLTVVIPFAHTLGRDRLPIELLGE